MSATSATGAAGTPARGEPLVPGGCVVLREVRLEERDQGVSVRDAVGVRSEARVDREVVRAELAAEQREEAIVPGRHHQLAVSCADHLVGRDRREAGSVTARHRPVREVAGEVVADVAERGLVEGDVDEATRTGRLALEQRGEDSEGRPGARALIDEGGADAHARASGLPRHRDQAACCLHQGVVAGLVPLRANIAVCADRAVDETGVPRS